jgi:hypothetical protein
MESTHTCNIDLPGLPLAARKAHLFPALADHALLSVGQLCNHGCHVHFTAHDVSITLRKQTLFTGVRAANGLWTVLLTHSKSQANAATQQQANAASSISPPSSNTSELLHYLHASCLSPRNADTVEFFPSKLPMPKLSSADAAQDAAQDLIAALQNPSLAAPFHPMGDAQLTALRQLATIFGTACPRVPTAEMNPKKYTARVTPIPSQETADTQLEAPKHVIAFPKWYASAVIDPDTRKSMLQFDQFFF